VNSNKLAWIALAGAWISCAGVLHAQDLDDAEENDPGWASESSGGRSDSTARAARAQPVQTSIPAPTQAAVQDALARYAREPSVERVVRAAVRAAGRDKSGALASRARTAGWVPRVGLRARRGQTVDLATSQTTDEEALRLSTDDDLTLEASLTFELDRVVFRGEEVALAREARAERQARAQRTRDVIALYFERRRLQLERDLGAPPSVARAARIAEIEALLDVFTNGAFQRMMARSRWTTAASTSAISSQSRQKSRSATTR
jgi:hypothetical protein